MKADLFALGCNKNCLYIPSLIIDTKAMSYNFKNFMTTESASRQCCTALIVLRGKVFLEMFLFILGIFVSAQAKIRVCVKTILFPLHTCSLVYAQKGTI